MYCFRFIISQFISLLTKEQIYKKIEEVDNTNWVVAGTQNQFNSLRFLTSSDRNFKLIVLNSSVITGDDTTFNHVLKLDSFRLHYLHKYVFFILAELFKNPIHFSRVFHVLISNIGLYESFVVQLKEYKVNSITISNDHSVLYRALLLATKQLKIPTIYLQHASVSDDFPPLMFDMSLLYGQNALDKYLFNNKEIHGIVKLVGIPKFDPFINDLNKGSIIKTIGIPYGLRDCLDDVKAIILQLRQQFDNILITIRKHPRDERVLSFEKSTNVLESDSKRENVFEYLKKQDLIISADSAIHLEATLLNVTSIYYRFSPVPNEYDIYGFVKNGLIDECRTEDQLLSKVQTLMANRKSVRNRVKYFYDIVNTHYDGKSQKLVKDHISEFLGIAK